jgi:hypothetical protein
MFNQWNPGYSVWKTKGLSLLLFLFFYSSAHAVDQDTVREEYRNIIHLCQDPADIGVHIFFPEAIAPDQPLWDLSRYNISLSWANSGDGDGRGRGNTLQVYCDEVTPETRDPDTVDPDEIEIY